MLPETQPKDQGVLARIPVVGSALPDRPEAAGEIERLSAMVKDVMENAAELKVPLIADVSYGPTWAEAH